jgi:ABC-type Fe3+-hydroxamate transport system substrate-binding protein
VDEFVNYCFAGYSETTRTIGEKVNEQVDVNKVIESLLRQIAEYAQKVALLEAFVASVDKGEGNEKGD